jgi:hypothetical protein
LRSPKSIVLAKSGGTDGSEITIISTIRDTLLVMNGQIAFLQVLR